MNYEATQMAHKFYNQVHERLDTIMAGEPHAKDMIAMLHLLGPAIGLGGVLMGPPGGGKSLLLDYSPYLPAGSTPGEHAKLKGRSDLSPAEVLGTDAKLIKTEIGPDGEKTTSELNAERVAKINQGKHYLTFDEVREAGTHLTQAMTDFLQRGKADSYENGEYREVDEVDFILFGMNNFGKAFGFSLSPAIISRMGMGAFVGLRAKGELSPAALSILYDDEYDSNDSIDPKSLATDYNRGQIHFMRGAVNEVPITREKRDFMAKLGTATLDCLHYEYKVPILNEDDSSSDIEVKEYGLDLSDRRFMKQIKRMVRGSAMLKGQEAAQDSDVLYAYQLSVVGKLGALGVGPDETLETFKDILQAA